MVDAVQVLVHLWVLEAFLVTKQGGIRLRIAIVCTYVTKLNRRCLLKSRVALDFLVVVVQESHPDIKLTLGGVSKVYNTTSQNQVVVCELILTYGSRENISQLLR